MNLLSTQISWGCYPHGRCIMHDGCFEHCLVVEFMLSLGSLNEDSREWLVVEMDLNLV